MKYTKSFLPILVIIITYINCSGEGGKSCRAHMECPEGQLCIEGRCQVVNYPDGGDLIPDLPVPDLEELQDAPIDLPSDIPQTCDFDEDSDNDTISDLHEGFGAVDTDGDGIPDSTDNDSDGDGILDIEEAGDNNVCTPPKDTDHDLIPDFRDIDDDGDGINTNVEGKEDNDGDGIPNYLDIDSDGDTILDLEEGAIDSDNDGIPNYLDRDSDGDGIMDGMEVGDDDLNTPPRDVDRDGIPDFLDDDSDGDTIPDVIEGLSDIDNDGLPGYIDFDSDGDGILDLTEVGDQDPTTPPIDTDGDGIPDYLDYDSDNDYISDKDEGIQDKDNDGIPTYLDLDSDGDGISDELEAGDQDINTPPRDTDHDRIPDFLDLDSDNDGLRDDFEQNHGTNPYAEDTDGDNVTDLIEVAAGTDPSDPNDNPQARGDFVFLEPYQNTPDPTRDTLDFSTSIKIADVYFLMDLTGSMSDDLDVMKNNLVNIIDAIKCDPGEDPDVTHCIRDVWVGFGWFTDYPSGYEYRHSADLTSNAQSVQSIISRLTIQSGGNESQRRATYCAATGNLSRCPHTPPRSTPCPQGYFGHPCFRPTSVPIIVLITDENMGQDTSPGAPTCQETGQALINNRIVLIGIMPPQEYSGCWDDLVGLCRCANSYDSRGNPLAFDAQAGGIVTTIQNAIYEVSQVPIDISAIALDDPNDNVDAVTAFIDRILPNNTGGGICTGGYQLRDSNGDGIEDTFVRVPPGRRVCFDVIPKTNVTVQPTSEPQMFRAIIQVWGNNQTLLDERDVYFLVPPVIPGGQ